jgi:hypothetical protein
MRTVDLLFFLFLFVCYSTLVFGFGYNMGFDDAIEQMKKVRNRK